ncbi:MAG TPA: 4-hydroxythreonine-4-phosphate dehydrogenase PdxA [Opitutaceae bacterium]|nr:4-hydroxythreonine-4-phosphate dehydrogenase PdxA [Opitutaceae bacterium]
MSERIAIACGDPAGVGPEVISSWLATRPEGLGEMAVIGPASWLATIPKGPARITVGTDDYAAVPGEPDGEGSLVAWAALERAAALCTSGEYSGVVTGPVSKERMAAIGWNFPGQTEFFASKWGGEPTMAFCGGKLRMTLVTWHIPLKDVAFHLTRPTIERAVLAADELARADGVAAPRIGVCGLNPHAGEGGIIGTEERDLIDPILDGLRQRLPLLSRCQPADTLFGRQIRGEFDVSVALYHDQGLGPLKAVDFEQSVNVTLGLAHVRTSPDHGTAFGIAGKGSADARSFTNAVEVARRLIRARKGR